MIVAITQARMSSSRFPGKVLKPICGYPMSWLQWERTKRARLIDQCVLATSEDESDDPLSTYFIRNNQLVFRGSLNNVLNRYYECAKQYKATHIVRLTADCPLIDPFIIDKTIEYHLKNENDYTCNSRFPIGMSVEVFRFTVLEKAYYEAKLRSQREHVTLFIYQHPELFKLGQWINTHDLSQMRWTVDYPEDFELVSYIFEKLYPQNPCFSLNDVLTVIENSPQLIKINAHIEHNQGLLKSLNNDYKMTYLDK